MKSDLHTRYKQFVESKDLYRKGHPVLISVSGGADSMVLCHLILKMGNTCGMAHINFKLRGKESDLDASFVKEYAKKHGIPFYLQTIPVKQYAKDQSISIQMAARVKRYEWLDEIRRKNGYHVIAVGHQMNDIAETMLLNLIKGTGIAGLHGIHAKQTLTLTTQVKIVRPLLFATRQEIREYAKSEKISYRDDSSNKDVKYQRNKLRNKVIPTLEEINPKLILTLAENATRFGEVQQFYNMSVARTARRLIQPISNLGSSNPLKKTFRISISKLRPMQAKATILHEILKDLGFNTTLVNEIAASLDGATGKRFISKTHRVIKDRAYLIVQPITTPETGPYMIEKELKNISFGSVTFSFVVKKMAGTGKHKPHISKLPNEAYLDMRKVTYPLTLRGWQQGDYFYPFGLKTENNGKIGKKKIGHYLIDRKVSASEKEKLMILTSGKKVCWVAGHRIDDRFKVSDNTEEMLVVKMKKRKRSVKNQ